MAEIRVMPQQNYNAGTGRFEQAKQMAANVQAPRREQRAQMRPAAADRGNFELVDTRFFSMQRPSGWNIYQNPQSQVVTIAPPNGLVRTGLNRVSLGYGAVLSYYRAPTQDANAATQQLVADLRAANPDLDIAGNSRGIGVNGTPGMLIPMTSWSPYGGRQSNWLLTVPRPEGLFYMMLVAPQRGGDGDELLQRMVSSLRFR